MLGFCVGEPDEKAEDDGDPAGAEAVCLVVDEALSCGASPTSFSLSSSTRGFVENGNRRAPVASSATRLDGVLWAMALVTRNIERAAK